MISAGFKPTHTLVIDVLPTILPPPPFPFSPSPLLQATCLWRRALVACGEITKLLTPAFSRRLGVEMSVAQGLVNRLEREGFVRAPPKAGRGRK